MGGQYCFTNSEFKAELYLILAVAAFTTVGWEDRAEGKPVACQSAAGHTKHYRIGRTDYAAESLLLGLQCLGGEACEIKMKEDLVYSRDVKIFFFIYEAVTQEPLDVL